MSPPQACATPTPPVPFTDGAVTDADGAPVPARPMPLTATRVQAARELDDCMARGTDHPDRPRRALVVEPDVAVGAGRDPLLRKAACVEAARVLGDRVRRRVHHPDRRRGRAVVGEPE